MVPPLPFWRGISAARNLGGEIGSEHEYLAAKIQPPSPSPTTWAGPATR
jgi:hypothetical protein